MTLTTYNPTTGQPIKNYARHSSDEIAKKIDDAERGFKTWSKKTFQERALPMHKTAHLLRENTDTYAKLMTTEMGKPIQQARKEILKCALACDFYADHAEEILKEEIVATEAKKSYISFEPLGIILAIMPWNFPFWQVFRCASAALMAGNCMLLKHASNVTGCSLAIEELLTNAGLPQGVFQAIISEHDAVLKIIEDPRIQAVTLTGSERAGISVGSTAGKSLKKTVLELGGSDPYIVLDDADIDACVSTALQARLNNTGQSCIAAKRFILTPQNRAKFTIQLLASLEKLKIGDPALEETEIGPLARKDLLDTIARQVDESLQLGAKLLYGGKKMERPGYFYIPTVIDNVRKGMPAFQEETFGPVFSLIHAETTDEAIALANDSSFGLGASIWTKDLKKAAELAKKIEAGNVFVNTQTVSHVQLPFGGIKRSGYGRELSHYGLKEFVNIKTVFIK